MRFTGQIRVPEVDHPGVPATFVVDDNQAEVILEGESLGRWSLFDVRVNRLVSSAFQVELAGEEITFLADEPVDFAYKGVEHMAEVWARYKTMTVPRRVVAVKRSRKGTTPSRIQEFHDAMIQNLRRERPGGSDPGEASMLAGESAAAPVPPPPAEPLLDPVVDVVDEGSAEAVIPLVGRSDEPDEAAVAVDRIAAERAEAERAEAAQLEADRKTEADRMAAERKSLAEERALLEEQKQNLDEALGRAELLEKERLEAAQMDMERIEDEKKALEERHERERQQVAHLAAREQEVSQLEEQKRLESERLDQERLELERLEAERVERERLETERLEAARVELEKAETERAEAARLEMERLEKERLELERLEAERVERERLETERERDEQERLEQERLELQKAEAERLEQEKAEAERLEQEKAEAERLEQDPERDEQERLENEREAAAAAERDAEPVGRVAEVLGTSAEGDLPETSKELVVDLGAFEEPDQDVSEPPPAMPEPALAGAPEKSGIMGAVRAAFTRNGKNHVHDFTEAPGGIGMVRYICRECGYVSISSAD